MARKLRVGVLFGGRSAEHEISLRSALNVMSAMDPERYEVIPIGIDRGGRWHLRRDAIKLLREAAPRLAALGAGGTPVTLLPHENRNALVAEAVTGRFAAGKSRARAGQPIDVILPVLHGTYGEDGSVQGLLELAGLPYVGEGVLGSALGLDKDAQKRLARDAGVPVVRFMALTRSDYEGDRGRAERFAGEVGYPVFVKPNALGSSVGISRVEARGGISGAIEEAFRYDRKILIEAGCVGREFECAVLGGNPPQASVPGEIVVRHGHSFYSYESKYLDPQGAELKIPAAVDESAASRLRELAIKAFRALGLEAMARVDFFARPDLGEIYFNEVNTIPGFTAISMYPKLWEASGVPLPRLLDRLIELALETHRERALLERSYAPRRPASGPARRRTTR